MITETHTFTFEGINVVKVNVEVHISSGIPALHLVGLADKTITESRERVRSALHSIGFALPAKRIVINLAPANIHKEGSHFDLAIACALLATMQIIPYALISQYVTIGELSLDSKIKPVPGILPAAIEANRQEKGIICAKENGQEALWSGNKNILTPKDLISLINHFKGLQLIPVVKHSNQYKQEEIETELDLKDVVGLKLAKRALEIAAAGEHNLLISGPPGVGKSMLAARLPSILPPLTSEEMLECSMIYSVAGLIKNGKIQHKRPFRAPHHSCSVPAMVGGGMSKRIFPGEISLSHNGVLFLDEFPEFSRAIIDSLRQPLENGKVLISRASNNVTFPAKFQLIAAMNPCKCGFLGDSTKECNKAPKCAKDYQLKISGPILDRIDINVEVPNNTSPILIRSSSNQEETSKAIYKRVIKAKERQAIRYKDCNFFSNAHLKDNSLLDLINITDESIKVINNAANKLNFSARSYSKILKLSRTIADLDESAKIHDFHIKEAISYKLG